MEIFDVYPLLDLEPVKAKGNYVFCNNGKKYLDFYGGHAVISIGHSHPHYVNRVSKQLNEIGFYSNSVQNSLQQKLASKLGELSGYEDYQLFLCNSGAEAVENALKMASFHTGKSKVVSFNKAFHGRTTTSLSVTDKEKYTAPINESNEVVFLELNDIRSLEKELSNGDVCAVIIEAIQGIGGIHIPDNDFLKNTAELCQEHNAVFICDEIQSGFGRTGNFFAHQHADIKPDIITVAKGMGNGFPVAGTILSPDFKAKHGQLGSTFGGNHLACAAATAVLEVLENEQLIQNAANIGQQLMEGLSKLPEVKEVRGRGLMIGIEFSYPIKKIRQQLIKEEQILTGVASDPNVLRLLPPLTIHSKEVDQFINAMKNILTQ
ncbi:aspartate aminotransferase family protein [Aliifodinibius salipaludis]|uniref:Aspartate aminotransferase family protein n=1 Tax=Fodinibius salipaludis TaxID=2032627 RepID=A0A2A2G9R9_9BACT|nr:aminotransferase class III-fold pyridoxal phosphate-dependent enzyme [Aliifodinibius salipaludis]PAU93599.1 aspartate aminotransferase family protein [Aliifodinibius salipaludis]